MIGLLLIGWCAASARSQDLTDAEMEQRVAKARAEVTNLGEDAPAAAIEKAMGSLVTQDELPKLAGRLDTVVIDGLKKYVASLDQPQVVVPDFVKNHLTARQEAPFEQRTLLLQALMNCYPGSKTEIMSTLEDDASRYALSWIEALQQDDQPDVRVELHWIERAAREKGKGQASGQRIVRMIEGSPLVQDPPALNVYSNGETTLLHRFGQLLSRAENAEAELRKLPQSAGRDLPMIYVTNNIPSLNDWCERYGEIVLALPKEEQMPLAVYFRKNVPPIPLDGDALGLIFTETTKKTLSTLRELAGNQAVAQLNNLGSADEPPAAQLQEIERQLSNGVFASLIRSDPERAMALFQRVAVLETELEKDTSEAQKNPHWDGKLSSTLMRDVMAPLDANDMAGVAFLLHILGLEERKPDNSRGRMAITDFTVNAMNSTIRKALDGAVRAPEDVTEFKEGFTTLAEAFKDLKYFELLESGLFSFFQQSRKQFTEPLILWLEKEPQQALAPQLATEIAMAIRFSRDVRAPRDTRNPMRPEEAYYHRYLADGFRMKGLRLRKALHLVSIMGKDTHPKILNATVDLLETQWRRGRPVSGKQVAGAIRLFLGQEQTPIWRTRAKRVAAAWSNASIANPTTSSDNRLLIELQKAANGEKGMAQAVARLELKPGFERDLNSIAALVRVGELDRAVSLLQDHWKAMKYAFNAREAFDDAIAQQLPEFLRKIPDEGLRFYAENLLVTAPRVPGISEVGALDRGRRLRRLAERFTTHPFEIPQMKERSRDRLLNILEIRKQMQTVLEEKSSEISLATLSEERDFRKILPSLVKYADFLRGK